MSLLSCSLADAACIHTIEEFAFPGGFKAWWRAYMPNTASSVKSLSDTALLSLAIGGSYHFISFANHRRRARAARAK